MKMKMYGCLNLLSVKLDSNPTMEYLQHIMILSGSYIKYQLLFQEAIATQNWNVADEKDRTLLHLASCFGDHNIVELLLKTPIDTSKKDKDGYTALDVAKMFSNSGPTDKNRADILELFFFAGQKLKDDRVKAEAARRLIVILSDPKISNKFAYKDILLEINKTNDINSKDPNTGDTVLHKACRDDDIQLIKSLLELGVNPLIENKDKKTALMVLSDNRFQFSDMDDFKEIHIYFSKFFSDSKKKSGEKQVNAVLKKVKESPLSITEPFNSLCKLIDKAGNINVKSPETGNTLLHLACKNCSISLIRDLLELGVDPFLENYERKTALSVIVDHKDDFSDDNEYRSTLKYMSEFMNWLKKIKPAN